LRWPRTRQRVQGRGGDRPAGEPGVAAGGGHVAQDLDGQHLAGGRQAVVNGVRAHLNRAAYSAGFAVPMAGQAVTVTVFPGQ